MNEDGLIKRALDKESFLGIDKFSTNRYFSKLNSDSEVDLVKSAKDPFCDFWEDLSHATPWYISDEFDDEDLGEYIVLNPQEQCEQERNAGALPGADVLERVVRGDNAL